MTEVPVNPKNKQCMCLSLWRPAASVPCVYVCHRLGSQASNKTVPDGFEAILMATHYTCLMGRCRDKGGKDCLELAAKVSITLLRYSDFIPCDKCFYQASLSVF